MDIIQDINPIFWLRANPESLPGPLGFKDIIRHHLKWTGLMGGASRSMTWFFERIFGTKNAISQEVEKGMLSVYDPTKVADRIAVALLASLQNQLDLLGFEIGRVPAEDQFTSEKCRGYLYGLSLGILISEGIELSRDALIDTVIAAFALTYGDEAGRELSFQTVQDVASGRPELISASDWAIEDVKGVYASGGVTSTAGFYLAASGMI